MAKWPYNTAAWQRLRLTKLANEPLCQPCAMRGKITEAKAVDHITAIAAGGDPFPPLSGLMSMCERCHNEKTASCDRKHKKPFARRFKGFDASGNPVDQSDVWHRGGGASNHGKRSALRPTSQMKAYLVLDAKTQDDLDDIGVS